MNQETNQRSSIRWHGAFATSIQYELDDYTDQITLETEHQLSQEALRIDVIVIKKDKDLKIEKNIGKIFKEYNLVEYKSPTDYLSIHDYNKVKGYAYLYSAFKGIDPEQVTVTFVVPEITPKLKSYLTDRKQFSITPADDGIYYIGDNSFSIQIIEQKHLSVDKNLYFGTLTNNPVPKDWATLLRELTSHGKPLKNNPLLEVLSQASPTAFKEAITMQTEASYMEVMKELGERIGLGDVNASLNLKMQELARKMLSENEPIEKIVFYTSLSPDTIKNL